MIWIRKVTVEVKANANLGHLRNQPTMTKVPPFSSTPFNPFTTTEPITRRQNPLASSELVPKIDRYVIRN
jgi:hypothetical protein